MRRFNAPTLLNYFLVGRVACMISGTSRRMSSAFLAHLSNTTIFNHIVISLGSVTEIIQLHLYKLPDNNCCYLLDSSPDRVSQMQTL